MRRRTRTAPPVRGSRSGTRSVRPTGRRTSRSSLSSRRAEALRAARASAGRRRRPSQNATRRSSTPVAQAPGQQVQQRAQTAPQTLKPGRQAPKAVPKQTTGQLSTAPKPTAAQQREMLNRANSANAKKAGLQATPTAAPKAQPQGQLAKLQKQATAQAAPKSDAMPKWAQTATAKAQLAPKNMGMQTPNMAPAQAGPKPSAQPTAQLKQPGMTAQQVPQMSRGGYTERWSKARQGKK